MKQPEYFIGIDIGSEENVAAVFTEPKAPVKTLPFENKEEGFSELAQWFLKLKITSENSVICMEATGVYVEALCYFLNRDGYNVAVEDPNKVKRAFKYLIKNDTVDSKQIGEYAYRHFDELSFWNPEESIIEQVKVLLTTREQFSKQLTANKNTLKAFKRKVIQTPPANEMLEATIGHLKTQIKAIDDEMQNLINQDSDFKKTVSLLRSIPGVQLLLSANLLVATKGFREYTSARQLAAYIGISPNEYQSGKSIRRKPRSRRSGPSRLRKLLHLAACTVRMHNDKLKRYFLRKLEQGKAKILILNNIANKLLSIIAAVIRTDTAYIEDYRSVNPQLLKTA